jgi:hypothetical protein
MAESNDAMNRSLRAQISSAISDALKPLPTVFAGWEGGSAAFSALDRYSDIDLTFLVDDEVPFEVLYASLEPALNAVSPITVSHPVTLGRYYKVKDGGEFLFIDIVFLRAGEPDHYLEVERHGQIIPLFDKGDWLRARPLDSEALAAKRDNRLRELQTWFPVSQSFVSKAILRGQHAEAVTAFWAYTVRPLAELLRMRYCPMRWDFGMRYLDRDLPPAAYNQIRDLVFVRDLADLEAKLVGAAAWGNALLRELDSV